ncbi:MAG: hypothetical protein GTO51_09640 [Candidatus Latescibacteria bacterium]|nr:hypothetical protein [Candidatus Latescibacterota bacterium]NIM22191.1 hypothetical protein [Candidatus Latescibacterota bacterium]NIM66230.1 hypothetical protein [Candidatus Latescibacterota bacterium]NIO02306.1 hypothetical protein [Candidatus Latescibacterota bacterium]NIO29837.1 hypothetical protein [Candidatus Latescibacterota bacterium]
MGRKVILLVLISFLLGWIPLAGAAEEESRLKFSGDLRGRFEGFWFERDETGSRSEDRRRIRYRLRLNAKATINDHAAVGIRVGTGDINSRSGNQTIGSPVDFGSNEFDVRQAYLVIMPFAKGELPNRDGHWKIQFGRVPNPFYWKNGKDMMLIDNDFNPGGISTNFDVAVSEKASIFANIAGFIVDENKAARDPFFTGFQGGIEVELANNLTTGVRGSFYYFDYLDDDFLERGVDGTGGVTSGGGNVVDGLTGDPNGGNLQVVETQAFLKLGSWPVFAFGGFSSNLSAEPSQEFSVEEENIAYNAGLEGGDKKKNVHLGLAYFFIEANAFPSQYIDSDLFDGRTNRKGFFFYGTRQLLAGADFGIKLFASDAIETDLAAFTPSVEDSERIRLQVDLIYEF